MKSCEISHLGTDSASDIGSMIPRCADAVQEALVGERRWEINRPGQLRLEHGYLRNEKHRVPLICLHLFNILPFLLAAFVLCRAYLSRPVARHWSSGSGDADVLCPLSVRLWGRRHPWPLTVCLWGRRHPLVAVCLWGRRHPLVAHCLSLGAPTSPGRSLFVPWPLSVRPLAALCPSPERSLSVP